MLGRRQFKYKQNFSLCSVDLTNKNVSSTNLLKITGLNSTGQLSNQISSWTQRKILVGVGPNGEPIATLLICLSNKTNDSDIHILSNWWI